MFKNISHDTDHSIIVLQFLKMAKNVITSYFLPTETYVKHTTKVTPLKHSIFHFKICPLIFYYWSKYFRQMCQE